MAFGALYLVNCPSAPFWRRLRDPDDRSLLKNCILTNIDPSRSAIISTDSEFLSSGSHGISNGKRHAGAKEHSRFARRFGTQSSFFSVGFAQRCFHLPWDVISWRRLVVPGVSCQQLTGRWVMFDLFWEPPAKGEDESALYKDWKYVYRVRFSNLPQHFEVT